MIILIFVWKLGILKYIAQKRQIFPWNKKSVFLQAYIMIGFVYIHRLLVIYTVSDIIYFTHPLSLNSSSP